MYTKLGIHWAASIPAFLALACIPFPLVFYKYGPRIRARCKYAAEAARVLKEMRAENRVIDESEAEDEVRDAERMEKLVKSMSRQSRKSVASRAAKHGNGVAGPATVPVPTLPSSEKAEREELVREDDEIESPSTSEKPKEEV